MSQTSLWLVIHNESLIWSGCCTQCSDNSKKVCIYSRKTLKMNIRLDVTCIIRWRPWKQSTSGRYLDWSWACQPSACVSDRHQVCWAGPRAGCAQRASPPPWLAACWTCMSPTAPSLALESARRGRGSWDPRQNWLGQRGRLWGGRRWPSTCPPSSCWPARWGRRLGDSALLCSWWPACPQVGNQGGMDGGQVWWTNPRWQEAFLGAPSLSVKKRQRESGRVTWHLLVKLWKTQTQKLRIKSGDLYSPVWPIDTCWRTSWWTPAPITSKVNIKKNQFNNCNFLANWIVGGAKLSANTITIWQNHSGWWLLS